jgi:Uma2 family endonuclease
MPEPGAALTLLTLEEFMARPQREDGQREELLEGELIVSPGPKVGHSEIVRRLRRLLMPLEERGYVLSNDFSCVLRPHSMPEPDLAAVRQERWQEALNSDAWLEGSPELVVEVASPSNRRLALKAAVYLEHGAEQVWLVYPKTQTVSVHTAERISEARPGESLEFHGVSIPVSEMFP